MTITAKTARQHIHAIHLLAAALTAQRITAAIDQLLEERDAAIWPAKGDNAGGSPGGHSDPTAARAASPAFRRAVVELATIEADLRAASRALARLTHVGPTISVDELAATKVRCGDRTPDHIRRDEWYTGDVAACEANAEEWRRADGSSAVRTSGLCVTHRKAWDDLQRERERRGEVA